MTNGLPVPKPCPSWCTGSDDELPGFPGDGFWHYGKPVTITVTHGRSELINPQPLEVCIKAWVPSPRADPQPALIELSLNHEEGPMLTPGEARQLAAILLDFSDRAGAAQQ